MSYALPFRPFDFRKLLLLIFAFWTLIVISAGIACCDEVQAARQRLQALESQKVQAAAVEAQQALDAAEQVLVPVPETFRRPDPQISFERSMAASVETYFAIFTKNNCSPCERMKREGVKESLEAAGHRVVVSNVDESPTQGVDVAPQVWLCDKERKPLRKWKGYHTAEQILTPSSVDGLCRLQANNTRWSGVSIGDGLILSVAHHEQTENFFVEFPLTFGGSDYVRLPAELVKSDEAADLSVLRFRSPDLITVQSYVVSELAADAVEVPGYLAGETPKRVKIRRRNFLSKIAGIAVDSYQGFGISSPQFGMSGSPLLTPDKHIAGIQAVGAGSEVGAVTVDTIRGFLSDVERDDRLSVASVLDAEPTAGTFAAVLAAHLSQCDDQPEDEIAYGSLFDLSVDVADDWKQLAAQLLAAKQIRYESAGITCDWSGPSRTFAVATDRITVSPGIRVTANKWRIKYSCSLDGVTYTPDLSSVTLLLSGAPDLTIRLN